MIKVEKLKAEDIFIIEKRAQTKGAEMHISKEDAEAVEKIPYSHSIFNEEGRLIAVGGVVPRWPGRGEAWLILAPMVRKYLNEIAEASLVVLNACEINRVDIAVRCDFPEGHEWASKLGFKAEAECLEAYDSEGNDCSMYARVKNRKDK